VRIRSCVLRVNSQVACLSKLTSTLPEEHLEIQQQSLEVLISKLKVANTKLDSVFKTSKVPVAKHQNGVSSVTIRKKSFVFQKQSLDKIIEELEKWQQIFDPSWYLMIRSATDRVDTELARSQIGLESALGSSVAITSVQSIREVMKKTKKPAGSVYVHEDGLNGAVRSTLSFSNITIALKKGSKGSRTYILDPVSCPTHADPIEFSNDVEELARKLVYSEPEKSNLLKCKGVLKHSGPKGQSTLYNFVFRTPENFRYQKGLRECLLMADKSHSLTDRFKLAQQLATAVAYVHAFGFVHKNVRPENFVILDEGNSSLGSAFLVGFAHMRSADGDTAKQGAAEWTWNLYQHPRRQGKTVEDTFIMQHDIYSLGVCLLELGLWSSFIQYNESEDLTRAMPSPALGISLGSPDLHVPELLQSYLLKLARKNLPPLIGTKYTQVVETCLTCLDPGNLQFGDEKEFEDSEGILVGVRYIEKVRVLTGCTSDFQN
jgi:hypothetical protein